MNQLTVNKLKEETKTLDLFTGGRRRRRYILPCSNFFWIFFPPLRKVRGKTNGGWKIIFIGMKGCIDK